ncbi:hypothetical protein B0T19DRAFT_247927 [Cercophora scortea]|uniref:ADP-ribose 1''-phosphate phosphatase n=1 Tax=Cercophora scortea TaxID=314031 RepID=A0AAE0I9F6_9PEZI|nr:hypothetical protein B0T19DRAFT_247927 [Cercophora scortea]
MPTKRTAASSGQDSTRRQFKQTKLNFGRPPSQPQQRPKQVQGGEDAVGLTAAPNEDQGDETRKPQTKNVKTNPEEPEESSVVGSTPADDGNGDGDDADLTTTTSAPSPTSTSPPAGQAAAPSKKTPRPKPKPSSSLRIIDKVGDLFDAPPRTVLIHACNCTGSWGGGIALAFKKSYPAAYEVYNAQCKQTTPDRLVGKALLIPPPPPPPAATGSREAQKQHYIGCLFTSKRYGRARDSPEEILKATGPAMRHLMRQIAAEGGGRVGEIRMCQINSGLFDVPWPLSRKAIQSLELRDEDVGEHLELPVDIVAYSRD